MRKQKILKDVQLTYDSNLRHVPLNILYRRSDKNGAIYLKKSEARALYLLLKEVFEETK